MPRREYKGGAQKAYLTAILGNSTANLTITCDNLTNWPTGANSRPFFVVVDRGTSTEEKILCSARNGNTLTVFNDGITNGRGSDGTSIASHSVNAAIEHIFTATDADEANAHVNDTTTAHGLTIANVVTTTGTQTLTNKTISGGTVNATTLQVGGVDAVSLSGTQTLTNKTLTAPTITTPTATVATSAQTSSYTLVLADQSKIVEVSNASANILTIPTNASVAFPVGTQIVVLQTGAGQTTIAGASGVTVNATPGLKLRAQWSVATLIKRAENTWVVVGDTVA